MHLIHHSIVCWQNGLFTVVLLSIDYWYTSDFMLYETFEKYERSKGLKDHFVVHSSNHIKWNCIFISFSNGFDLWIFNSFSSFWKSSAIFEIWNSIRQTWKMGKISELNRKKNTKEIRGSIEIISFFSNS